MESWHQYVSPTKPIEKTSTNHEKQGKPSIPPATSLRRPAQMSAPEALRKSPPSLYLDSGDAPAPRHRSILPSAQAQITEVTMSNESGPLALHQAVMRQDLAAVKKLVSVGIKPQYLDDKGKSALDILDSIPIDPAQKIKFRQALLASQNLTAPAGHIKPEALHGSPWGLEILLTGKLRGGVNDAKGGSQSLEGKVFFSDRTPLKTGDEKVRSDLRKKPRQYAKGLGIKPSTATNRGQQYQIAQAMLICIKNERPLNMSGGELKVEVKSENDIDQELKLQIQALLTKACRDNPELIGLSAEEIIASIQLPSSIIISTEQNKTKQNKTISESELKSLYPKLILEIQQDLANGKAPFLNLVNGGKSVPMIFGFSKIENLESHQIQGISSSTPSQFSYQNKSHPLSGSENGGKLREIEVGNLSDLSTVLLGCEAKGAHLPKDVAMRISPTARVKEDTGVRAEYLTSDQVDGFKNRLMAEIAKFMNVEAAAAPDALKNASIVELQAVNAHIRCQDLSKMVPQRVQAGNASRAA
jgi:hypothetical protein